MISRTHLSLLLATGFGLLLVSSARAQWTQQDFTLKPGWNAVYFHVDASYASLDEIVGTDSANPPSIKT